MAKDKTKLSKKDLNIVISAIRNPSPPTKELEDIFKLHNWRVIKNGK